jgi:hypothetical protein
MVLKRTNVGDVVLPGFVKHDLAWSLYESDHRGKEMDQSITEGCEQPD